MSYKNTVPVQLWLISPAAYRVADGESTFRA